MNKSNQRDYIVTIKEVGKNELSKIFSLFVQLSPTAKESTFRKNYERAKSLGYKPHKAVIDENKKKCVVGLIGYIFNEDLCVGRAMYVDVLVVDKNWRRNGIGKQLIDFAISKLYQDKHARFLRWTTRNDLTEAVSFYKNKIAEPIGYYYRIDNSNFQE
jgi:GNAT superfamily N-acetyltransferase